MPSTKVAPFPRDYQISSTYINAFNYVNSVLQFLMDIGRAESRKRENLFLILFCKDSSFATLLSRLSYEMFQET